MNLFVSFTSFPRLNSRFANIRDQFKGYRSENYSILYFMDIRYFYPLSTCPEFFPIFPRYSYSISFPICCYISNNLSIQKMQSRKIRIRADNKSEFFEIFNLFLVISFIIQLFNLPYRVSHGIDKKLNKKVQFISLSLYFHYTYTKSFDLSSQ